MQIIDSFLAAQTQQSITAFVIAIGLSFVFVLLGRHIDKVDPLDKPSKIIAVLELYYSMMNNLFESVFNGKAKEYIPYVSMLMVYILVMNYISVFIPIEAPTTDYNTPLGLVLITVFLIHFTNIKYNGLKTYLTDYFRPFKFFVIMNVIEVFSRPFSMSMRMFCNLLSGSMIGLVIYQVTGYLQTKMFIIGPVSDAGLPYIDIVGGFVGMFLNGVFGLFFGGIQAFIFTILTMIFISLTVNKGEGEEKEEPVLATAKLVEEQ